MESKEILYYYRIIFTLIHWLMYKLYISYLLRNLSYSQIPETEESLFIMNSHRNTSFT